MLITDGNINDMNFIFLRREYPQYDLSGPVEAELPDMNNEHFLFCCKKL
jgi:hypothetical protein